VHPLPSLEPQGVVQVGLRQIILAQGCTRSAPLVVPQRILAEHARPLVGGKPCDAVVQNTLGVGRPDVPYDGRHDTTWLHQIGLARLGDPLRPVRRYAVVALQSSGDRARHRRDRVRVAAVVGAAQDSPPDVSLGAINAERLCIASGEIAGIDALASALAARGVSCQRLRSTHAYHSRMMETLVEPLTDVLRRVTLHPPRIPYVSCITGTWITDAEATDPAYWARHLCRTVRIQQGLGQLLDDPARVLLEVGPGQGLTSHAIAERGPRENPVIPTMRWSVTPSTRSSAVSPIPTITPEHVRVLRRRGIDRVSMGIETLDASILDTIHRRHSPAQALDACSLLVESGLFVNVDLIYALPGQTESGFAAYARLCGRVLARAHARH